MRDLIDEDGENRAVRCFLAQYQCGADQSVKSMKIHLEHSGFNGCWPDWVDNPENADHLTKLGAQNWLRHLFALELANDADSAQEQHPDSPADLQRQIASSYIDHIAKKHGQRKVPCCYTEQIVGDALREFLEALYPTAAAAPGADDKCESCNGYGVVGGGLDQMPCTDCMATGKARSCLIQTEPLLSGKG